MSIRNKLKSKITISFIVSTIFHTFIIMLFFKTNTANLNLQSAKKGNSKKSISLNDVKFISKKQLEIIKKQIVSSEKNGKKLKPINSKFSGEIDQVFDRQTLAQNIGTFKEAGLGAKNSAQSDKNKVQKNTSKPTKELKLSDLGQVNSTIPVFEKMQKENIENTKVQGLENGKVGTIGLAQNNDFVEEVPLGDVTNLNTTENKYFGFYHRIKQKLEQHWGSTIQDRAKRLYKVGRRLPASENLITAITVILNDKGDVVDIKIEGTSGVRELDQAAVESFNKAGPFPNPPKGLLVDGRATIQWGFVVKS